MTSRDLGYLEDMRVHGSDAVGIALRIGRESFLTDRTMQHAVIRCLTVIGEAANRVSADTRVALPEISWAEAVGLRNVLVHFDMSDMHDELRIIFGREVDLLTRRAVESSLNPIRKSSILSSAVMLDVA